MDVARDYVCPEALWDTNVWELPFLILKPPWVSGVHFQVASQGMVLPPYLPHRCQVARGKSWHPGAETIREATHVHIHRKQKSDSEGGSGVDLYYHIWHKGARLRLTHSGIGAIFISFPYWWTWAGDCSSVSHWTYIKTAIGPYSQDLT